MYYEDYYEIPEEDLKTDFHIALDDLIDAEVEKRLKDCIKDIDALRENQKQYNKKIAEAQQKVKEAETKQHEARIALIRAERERDDTIKQCEQSISDATQQKIDEIFGHWLTERYAYYLTKDDSWETCPYCNRGDVNIKLPNGDKAVTKCKVCNGQGHIEYTRYKCSSITTSYPTFIKENRGEIITPCFIETARYYGLARVPLRDIMTEEEAEKKAKKLTEENKQKALKKLEERKKKLDEEN